MVLAVPACAVPECAGATAAVVIDAFITLVKSPTVGALVRFVAVVTAKPVFAIVGAVSKPPMAAGAAVGSGLGSQSSKTNPPHASSVVELLGPPILIFVAARRFRRHMPRQAPCCRESGRHRELGGLLEQWQVQYH
jgi:hypothetical protein